MTELLALTAIGIFAAAAAEDVAHRRIANRLVVGLALIAVLRLALGLATGAEVTPLRDLVAALAVFGGGVAAFHFGMFGGGDAKLLGAGALWTGAGSVGAFLFVTALAGGVLAFGFLLWARHARGQGGDPGRLALPYGVAIAAGGILATTGLV